MRASRTVTMMGLLAGSAIPALSQGRPSSLDMTCGQTARLVASRGALVLGTGGQTYDRYVSDGRFCEVTQITRREVVPTRDNPTCFVGYSCREPADNRNNDF